MPSTSLIACGLDVLQRLALATLAALSLLSMAACSVTILDGPKAKGTVLSSVEGARSVSVSTENGRIELIQDPHATKLEITADVLCFGDTQEEADLRLQQAELLATPDAQGLVRVSVQLPDRKTKGWLRPSDSIAITIRAADLSGVEAVSCNGAIIAGGFRGPAKLVTINGSIRVQGHAGSVVAETINGAIQAQRVESIQAETTNGSIRAELSEGAVEDVSLETTNGSVSLVLPASWKGQIRAETSNGQVRIDNGGVVTKGGDSQSVNLEGGKAKARVETTNGRVDIRITKN